MIFVAQTEEKKKSNSRISDIVYIGMSAAIIAVCAWIQIPLTVPITLQTMGVALVAGLFGAKRGTLATLLYILIGAIGVPVFSGFKSGFGVLLGSTGGYIIGFIFTALIVGLVSDKTNKLWAIILSMVLGVLVCYAFGTVWFAVVYAKTNEHIFAALIKPRERVSAITHVIILIVILIQKIRSIERIKGVINMILFIVPPQITDVS